MRTVVLTLGISAAVAAGVVSTPACGAGHSYALGQQTPFVQRAHGRAPGRGPLTAVTFDLEVTNREGGQISLAVRRASLGRTDAAYAWDWKGATASNFSMIDMTRQFRQDGVVRAWDVDAAEPGKMRLKVWREWDSEWRVLSQSPMVSTTPGLNHFTLNPALRIRAGDYLGLYIESGRIKLVSPLSLLDAPALQSQGATNLAWSTARNLQYNIAGDATCMAKASALRAPNPGYALKAVFEQESVGPAASTAVAPPSTAPLTILDFDKEVHVDSIFNSWDLMADSPGMFRLVVWRREGAKWRVVSRSQLQHAETGLNRFSLHPAIQARKGDYLGFFTDYPQSGTATQTAFPMQVDACDKLAAGKLYSLGDFDGSIDDVAAPHDPVGHYAFRAFSVDVDRVIDDPLPVQAQFGRHRYRVSIPPQEFAEDEVVELRLSANAGTNAILHSSSLSPEYLTADGTRSAKGLSIIWLGLGLAAIWAMSKRQGGRAELIWVALAVVAVSLVWIQWVPVPPLASLAPSLVVLLMVPGFLLLELAMPTLAARLDPFERAPLIFGLSMAVWTVVAPVVYRNRWSSQIFVSALLVAFVLIIGVLLFRRGRRRAEPASVSSDSPAIQSVTKAYACLMLALVMAVMVMVGWRAQFQGAGSDTVTHIAGVRKVAESTVIVGGNPLLGPGFSYLATYAENPWYLALGLSVRLTHRPESAVLAYVIVTTLLTALVFLAFYSLLKAFTVESLAAILGTILVVGPWVLGYAHEWKVFHSYFFEFLGYQSTFTALIVFPLLTAHALRFARGDRAGTGVAVAGLGIAAMGMHAQYLVWVPMLVATGLLAASLPPSRKRARVSTLILVGVIACAAAVIGYEATASPLADKPSTWDIDREIGLWTYNAALPLWRPTAALISQDPVGVFDHKIELVGLLALLVLTATRFQYAAGQTREVRVTWRPETVGLAIAAIIILTVPWLVAFNPLVATPIFRILHSPIPIYRIESANVALTYAALFGGIAVVWSQGIRAAGKTQSRIVQGLVHTIPLVTLVTAATIVWLSPSERANLLAPLHNQAWFPNLLDLSNDKLYRGLSALPPGNVAISQDEAELIAAMTPHHAVIVRSARIGDATVSPQRAADNEALLNLSASSAELRQILRRVNCQYIVVPKGSPALQSFRLSPVFTELFVAESAVVFAVKSL